MIRKILCILFFTFSMHTVHAKQIIKVGAYDFKPYYVAKESKDIVRETVFILNKLQHEFDFKIVPMPAKRRYEFIANNTVDIVIYEDLAWGWKNLNINFYSLPITDGEIFFSKPIKNHDDKYFESLANKTIAVILGYHYKLTSFENFEGKVFPFKLITAKDSEQVLDIMLSGRADIGLLAHSYLKYSLKHKKHFKNGILLSRFYDHQYNLGIIHGTQSKISKEKMSHFTDLLIKSHQYLELLKLHELNK